LAGHINPPTQYLDQHNQQLDGRPQGRRDGCVCLELVSDVRQRSVDINVSDLHGPEYRRVMGYHRTTFSGRIFTPERGLDGAFQIDVAPGMDNKTKGP